MSDRDLDAEFARIIAGWDDEAPDPQARERDPAAPDDAPSSPETADPAEPPTSLADSGRSTGTDEPPSGDESTPSAVDGPQGGRSTDPAVPPQQPASGGPSGASGLLELPIAPTTSHAWRASTPRADGADDGSDGDDHFVPPSEIDLPSAETDPMFWAIVTGLAGGPLLLLYVLFFDRDGSAWWVVTALTMVVVGFVLLVLRGGTERDPFDDGTRV